MEDSQGLIMQIWYIQKLQPRTLSRQSQSLFRKQWSMVRIPAYSATAHTMSPSGNTLITPTGRSASLRTLLTPGSASHSLRPSFLLPLMATAT